MFDNIQIREIEPMQLMRCFNTMRRTTTIDPISNEVIDGIEFKNQRGVVSAFLSTNKDTILVGFNGDPDVVNNPSSHCVTLSLQGAIALHAILQTVIQERFIELIK